MKWSRYYLKKIFREDRKYIYQQRWNQNRWLEFNRT